MQQQHLILEHQVKQSFPTGGQGSHPPPSSKQPDLPKHQAGSSLQEEHGNSCSTKAYSRLPCHLVRLKSGSLGCSSVIYANKSMHSHKICKEGHLSVWHNLQLSEPTDIPDIHKEENAVSLMVPLAERARQSLSATIHVLSEDSRCLG